MAADGERAAGDREQDADVSELELPRNLVREVEAYDGPGSARRAWMADLPLIVDELAQR